MSLSPQQDQAMRAVRAWLDDEDSPQIFRLFGYAGTGKTTIAKTLAGDLESVCFACFTGKAALVLRSKGCDGASTIHSLIYKFDGNDPVTGAPRFVLNRESPAAEADLIVVDEVSMVGEAQALDLLSFGTKVLVLGDPAQLPPVAGEGYFINGEPDFMLTEVHRQAQDSPIILMSMDVRAGRPLALGSYGGCQVISRMKTPNDQIEHLTAEADQVLCGRNLTRQVLNASVRRFRGLAGASAGWLPTVGDRLVCLRNDSKKNLLNGGIWAVHKVKNENDPVAMTVTSMDVTDLGADVSVDYRYFNGREEDMKWYEKRNNDSFTYGWALTVHKSQGSQWNNVVVYDESSVFRESAQKHLYTAITRAAERLTVIV